MSLCTLLAESQWPAAEQFLLNQQLYPGQHYGVDRNGSRVLLVFLTHSAHDRFEQWLSTVQSQ